MMRARPIGFVTSLGVGLAILAGCSGRVTSHVETTAVDLAVPGRANATVSLAASGATVAVVWGATTAAGTDIYLAISRDAGVTFTAPVRVNDQPGDARVNGEQPPRVALTAAAGADPAIVVVWTSRRPEGTALLFARSTDGGRSFSAAANVPGSEGAGNRGWESVAAASDGRVLTAWLDHRQMAVTPAAPAAPSTTAHAGHTGHAASDETTAAKSMLYFASVGGAALDGRPLTGGVCYCCKTAMAVAPDGAIYLAWRHVYPGNFRDIAITVSRDGGRTFAEPARISEDGWSISGCPENGPSLAVDRAGVVHVAWITHLAAPESTPALFHATSSDAGRTFTPRQRIATTAAPSHVQMTLDAEQRPVLVWEEFPDEGRRVMMTRRTSSFSTPVRVGDARGSYPAVVTAAGRVVVAWTSGPAETSVIRVQRTTD